MGGEETAGSGGERSRIVKGKEETFGTGGIENSLTVKFGKQGL